MHAFSGAVVGVNTAILSTSGTFSGVGFALPIDTVAKNVGAMIEEGTDGMCSPMVMSSSRWRLPQLSMEKPSSNKL